VTTRPAVLPTLLGVYGHARGTRRRLAAFQDARLRRLVRHAYANVPYYRDLFDQAGLDPRRIRGVADLGLVPVSSKSELRAQPPARMLASGLNPGRLLTARTSGSSGEPFSIRRTWLESALQYLLRLRASGQFGVGFRDRVAAVGLTLARDPSDRKIVGRLLGALGIKQRTLINGLDAPDVVAAQLREARPDAIVGMPGMLCRVADHLIRRGERDLRPRAIVVGGEVMTRRMRERMEEAFGAPVFETYGSHEFPLLAWQCPTTGALHVCEDGVVLEVLRDGKPVAQGEQGEVVATNLHAYAMPFIRYRLGDVVTHGEDSCACGQPFATIRAVQGRMIDYFPLPDGRIVHPYEILALMIRGDDAWMAQYQLLQERLDRIVLRVVPTEAPGADRLARIERAVRPLLGHDVGFEVLVVDDLPLEQTGKFRPSRSLVRSEYGANR
jgi:phenylacetate-CoA ligase